MKKGFTLIEVMVVIVIIGILAAIAVPKMLGMTGKAKASEIGPAAGSWAKLITSYVLEKDSTGGFAAIGYIPPGGTTGDSVSQTANFRYTDSTSTSLTGHFYATNRVKMANCELGTGLWAVSMVRDSLHVTVTIPTLTDCSTLTPNFSKLQ
ncbi:MAG TPA: prepilin-type N-terminal cleavage/methylation domain-containing protein [Fibrobacteraceae bacterium]|nr:prepilin-type N-terminal cleavage/methylation domain-containing protein [Fibrobacteraceae bacterium]